MTLRVVSLDLDDTLWDCKQVILKAEAVLREWLQERYPKITEAYSIEEMRAHRFALIDRQPNLKHNLSKLRQVSLEMIASEFNYSPELSGPANEVFLEARNRVTLYEDVLPVLEKLAKEYSLIALTNGNADIEKVGLGHLFDKLISAADVGTSKPAPEMFHAISRVSGASIDEIIHVGDDPVHDIQGAHSVGMRCVWVNRDELAWPDEHEPPHAEVRNLHELIPLLAEWGGG